MRRIDRTKNRSDKYQHVLLETSCSPEIIKEVAESSGLNGHLNPYAYNEDLLDLHDELREVFRELIDKLTPRQKEVITLYFEHYTQTEIAKRLNVNQSSIAKCINGNCDYKNGKRTYGGLKKRLKKLAEQDEKAQAILERIQELRKDMETF